MEEKEGNIGVAPDSLLPVVSNDKTHQTFDLINTKTSNSMMCSVQSVQDINASQNYLINTNIHNSLAVFPTLESSQDKPRGASEDERLLDAAKSGLTDVILHLIEEEGQQLHSQRDKV